jgi:hypothetical protein
VLYKKQDGSGYDVIEEWEAEEDCDRYTRLMQIVRGACSYKKQDGSCYAVIEE